MDTNKFFAEDKRNAGQSQQGSDMKSDDMQKGDRQDDSQRDDTGANRQGTQGGADPLSKRERN